MTDSKNTQGAPPREIHIEKKKPNWLLWLLLGLALLAALFALSRCNRATPVAVAPMPTASPATPPVAVEHITLPNGKIVDLQPATLNYELQAYLASTAATPRTFTFDRLNFDTASSQIRADDRPTLSALSQVLAAYPKAKVRLVGYADTRGNEAANAKLGADRAAAVARSLTDGGIEASRISTASGSDSNPVASNATAGGQFQNRRTELVVTDK